MDKFIIRLCLLDIGALTDVDLASSELKPFSSADLLATRLGAVLRKRGEFGFTPELCRLVS
jgi:hypothetical protein